MLDDILTHYGLLTRRLRPILNTERHLQLTLFIYIYIYNGFILCPENLPYEYSFVLTGWRYLCLTMSVFVLTGQTLCLFPIQDGQWPPQSTRGWSSVYFFIFMFVSVCVLFIRLFLHMYNISPALFLLSSPLHLQVACECYGRLPCLGGVLERGGGGRRAEGWTNQIHCLLASANGMLAQLYHSSESGKICYCKQDVVKCIFLCNVFLI